ncbi:MAG: winged helix-turn-helix domain-containing protein, partial [Rhizomicrobium sp.]
MNERFARAGAIARIELGHEPDFVLGGIEVRPARREIVGEGWHETVEPRVMQVLAALARARGEILTRDDLIESCWDGVIVGEDAINRCIGRLRKLAEASGNAFSIETTPRVGYRLKVREIGPRGTTGGATALERPRAHAPKRSVCVLPFSNMSSDPEQEYFSDGISEDVITDLAKVSALLVVARNTAFQFKGKAIDIPRIARELNVSHVLEGSVRKSGNRVRITAQLIDGTSGDHVWAERYDRDLTDIFALQDEISKSIIAALKVNLLPDEKWGIERRAIERRATNNPHAYDFFLMARQHYV